MFAVFGILPFLCPRAEAAPATCESLAQFKVDHGEITAAQAVPAGPLTVQGFMGARKVDLPAFCRVTATLRPTADSDIKIEVWLPASGWNGRLEAVGNGGLAGSIGEDAMAGALWAGYATAGTDTGHTGSPMTGEWALGHPEKVIDFGWRAMHLMTVEAKALIAAYYGAPEKYAYWNGCSEGGGQALSEAQRFPDDYDGILAGAPANYFVHLQMGGNWISQAIHEDPATMIAPAKLPAITAAVLAECDMLDGVKDGVLEDPRQCHFDPGEAVVQGRREQLMPDRAADCGLEEGVRRGEESAHRGAGFSGDHARRRDGLGILDCGDAGATDERAAHDHGERHVESGF